MQEVKVNLGDRSYVILICRDRLAELGAFIKEEIPRDRVLVVTDKNVGALYGEKVLASLKDAGLRATIHSFPAGEESKNAHTLQGIYDALVDGGYSRSSTILALGGGVVGDLAGFAAATYMRGIAFVQVPTSLLAMVDSSVGGKTGINHPGGKNLIGAFYQPQVVFADMAMLSTLDPQELHAGMAEVIKYGMIWDADLFATVADNMDRLTSGDWETLGPIIKRCCEIKADIVSRDEREGGLRAVLNFGHTIGHAIESLTEYKTYRHGEAVAVGMVAASRIAMANGMMDDIEVQQLWQVIVKSHLPYRIGNLDPRAILDALKKDKKVQGGVVRFVLPTRIGKVEIRGDITSETVLEVLEGMKE